VYQHGASRFGVRVIFQCCGTVSEKPHCAFVTLCAKRATGSQQKQEQYSSDALCRHGSKYTYEDEPGFNCCKQAISLIERFRLTMGVIANQRTRSTRRSKLRRDNTLRLPSRTDSVLGLGKPNHESGPTLCPYMSKPQPRKLRRPRVSKKYTATLFGGSTNQAWMAVPSFLRS
jgi:hypothetical protein